VTWSRLDDSYPHHPKIMAAGSDAMALDVAGICYASRYLTDGFVPDGALAMLGPITKAKQNACRLVKVGRWERDEKRGGWWVHDYLEYNPSRAEVEDRRRKRSRAGRLGGARSGESRRSKREAGGEASA
jgi:hypothetical protein